MSKSITKEKQGSSVFPCFSSSVISNSLIRAIVGVNHIQVTHMALIQKSQVPESTAKLDYTMITFWVDLSVKLDCDPNQRHSRPTFLQEIPNKKNNTCIARF